MAEQTDSGIFEVKALVQDERCESRRSDPINLAFVFFLTNDEVSSETKF